MKFNFIFCNYFLFICLRSHGLKKTKQDIHPEEEGAEKVLTVEVYGCPRVPEVDRSGNLNHESMIQHVNDRDKGVWRPYTDRWEG